MLIVAGIDINRRDATGLTPFTYALESSNESAAKLLIEYGVKIDSSDAFHIPMVLATQNNMIDIVKYLLDNGADPAQKDHTGNSAIDYAINMNHAELLKLFHHQT